jgi:hypothetical protein
MQPCISKAHHVCAAAVAGQVQVKAAAAGTCVRRMQAMHATGMAYILGPWAVGLWVWPAFGLHDLLATASKQLMQPNWYHGHPTLVRADKPVMHVASSTACWPSQAGAFCHCRANKRSSAGQQCWSSDIQTLRTCCNRQRHNKP